MVSIATRYLLAEVYNGFRFIEAIWRAAPVKILKYSFVK